VLPGVRVAGICKSSQDAAPPRPEQPVADVFKGTKVKSSQLVGCQKERDFLSRLCSNRDHESPLVADTMVLADTGKLKMALATAPRVPPALMVALNSVLTYLFHIVNVRVIDMKTGRQKERKGLNAKGAARELTAFSLVGSSGALKKASSRWCRRRRARTEMPHPLLVACTRGDAEYATAARLRCPCARSKDSDLADALFHAAGDQAKIVVAFKLHLRAIIETIGSGDVDDTQPVHIEALSAYLLDKIEACLVAEEDAIALSFLVDEFILMREAAESDDATKVLPFPQTPLSSAARTVAPFTSQNLHHHLAPSLSSNTHAASPS
jgi:hypothetical protein